MIKKIPAKFAATVLTVTLLLAPSVGIAQESPQAESSPFVLGSFLLSILHFPVKLATCVGTQVTGLAVYAATYGVPGNYDGGTNGREIGEIARRSCTGEWIIPASQVRKDYGN